MKFTGIVSGLAMALALVSVLSARGDEPIYEPGNGVSTPTLVHTVYAQYTADAMRRRVEGKVVLACVVDREGIPQSVTVVKPLDDEIDQVSVRALKRWRFEAGTKAGKPVSVRIFVEMSFSMKR